MEAIQRLLKRAWWRLVVIDLLGTLAFTLAAMAMLLVLWRILQSLVPLPGSWGTLAGIGAGAAFVFAVVWSLIRTRQGDPVARRVDERAGLRETLSTALCVSAMNDPWSQATVELAGRRASEVNLKSAIPVEAPRLWPAPVAAWGLLAILLAVPVINLPALMGQKPPPPSPEQQAQQVSVEVEQMKEDLKAEAARLGVDINFDDEDAAENALAPTDLTPEEIQAAAVKQLTQLTDKLAEEMQEKGADKLEALEKQLEQLRQPGPGPAQELARAMARGDFDKAREELSKLAQQMNQGELSEEQSEQLQKQMENLAQQMQKLSEQRKETEQALRQAGMNSEQAKELASNPEALQKALEEMQNMTQEQKQQLMQQAMAQAQAAQQCSNMSQAMSQMAQNMSQQGMSAQGQQAMDQLGDMLSEMEMLEGDMSSMQAMMNAAQQRMNQMGKGFCDNPGSGEGEGQGKFGNTGQWAAGDTSRMGDGSGGPGQGHGVSPDAKETSVTFNNTKANVATREGPIIGSRLVYEGQIRGESRVEFAQSASAAASNASDAIESMQVPREYESAVMKYFGALREKAEPAKDTAKDE